MNKKLPYQNIGKSEYYKNVENDLNMDIDELFLIGFAVITMKTILQKLSNSGWIMFGICMMMWIFLMTALKKVSKFL